MSQKQGIGSYLSLGVTLLPQKFLVEKGQGHAALLPPPTPAPRRPALGKVFGRMGALWCREVEEERGVKDAKRGNEETTALLLVPRVLFSTRLS